MRREFLQLAKTFKQGKDDPSGMYISEKLDGARCFWDSGITRGRPTTDVPWANIIDPKTGERKKKIKPESTGLWSRYGNPIMAPDWFLNQLPAMFLDGELHAGRGTFQKLMSATRKDVAVDEEWGDVKFAVFSAPTPGQVFASGEIKNPNFHLIVDQEKCLSWCEARNDFRTVNFVADIDDQTFEDEINLLQAALIGGETCYLHNHVLLSTHRKTAESHMNIFMDQVLDQGGEGVMLRDPKSVWTPKRVSSLLKLKPFNDDQGTVTGFVSGRETDKGSKLRGLIGALILDYKGKRLELSGFTDEERRFESVVQAAHAYNCPGEEMPDWFQGTHFKIGDTVEFRYRELSDDLIPKEARYLRQV